MEKKLINEARIDLACGNNKRDGYFGIDVAQTPSVDHVWDLQQFPWPIESNSAEEVNCSHYIEHIPHKDSTKEIKEILSNSDSFDEFKWKVLNKFEEKDGLINFFNEVYRILKPGGKVYLVAPYYTSARAYGDPTHVRYIADSSLWYLSKEWVTTNHLEHYGLDCDFDVKISYFVTNDITLKSEEYRQKAFLHDWNVIDDIIIELTKK